MSKAKKSVEATAATDSKIAELDQKGSDRFNRLETLLTAKNFQPTFSPVKVTPSHSPPANVAKDMEPFFQPTSSISTSQLVLDRPLYRSPSPECTGPDSPAVKQPSAAKLQSD